MAGRKRKEKTGPIPTAEELSRLAELIATPIDFAELIADGVLVERGGGWYEVLDYERLPEHARQKIVEVEAPNLVKFAGRKNHRKGPSK
jgi:hypothetical protein